MPSMPSETNEFFRRQLMTQISADLIKYLGNTGDSKKRLRHMARQTNIHARTLLRLSRCENKPVYATVFKIYKHMLHILDDRTVLQHCPEVVRNYLATSSPSVIHKSKVLTKSIDENLFLNPVFAEIYVLSRINKVQGADIALRFGRYGINLIEEMCQEQILRALGNDEYILIEQSTVLSPKARIRIGKQFTNVLENSENFQAGGVNFISFIAEGLSDEAYQMWLKADEEALKIKMDISRMKSNSGINKVFSFAITAVI